MIDKAHLWLCASLVLGFGACFAMPVNAERLKAGGVYTDKPGYAPGETIKIHGSAPYGQKGEIIMRLVRVSKGWPELARTGKLIATNQVSRIGSFLEIPGLSLAGRKTLTIEGWWQPTILGTDTVAIAGQLGLKKAAVGIAVSPEGKPIAYASTSADFNTSNAVVARNPLKLDTWHHLAMTLDGQHMILYIDGKEVTRKVFTGSIAKVDGAFRIGARSEAPGDMTGNIDGRLDAWTVWSKALTAKEIQARVAAKTSSKDPVASGSEVLLYLGFEDSYGSVTDSSTHKHKVIVLNHGVPRIAGINKGSAAFGLHHDQCVDAGWPVSGTIKIPDNAKSGLYALQALVGPAFKPPGSNEPMLSVMIRPKKPTPGAKVAVIVPINTWNAYNGWPGIFLATAQDQPKGGQKGITSRPRTPGGAIKVYSGNNSAYGEFGDTVTRAYYQGWKRPSRTAWIERNNTSHSVRAQMTAYLVTWLESVNVPYDVYTDLDFHKGHLPNDGSYRTIVFHGHHEYWSNEMLDNMTSFANKGGSVMVIGGNIITWRVTWNQGEDVMEVRKWPQLPLQGAVDRQNAMDKQAAGSWIANDLCNKKNNVRKLGSVNHLIHPCKENPKCWGKWLAKNANHWLWKDLIKDGETFGKSPINGVFTAGHEADVYHKDFMPLGLRPGAKVTVLADGINHSKDSQYLDVAEMLKIDCELLKTRPIQDTPARQRIRKNPDPQTRSGHIFYYPHKGGGHVLVVGSTAAPWSLSADKPLGGMVRRAIQCFAYDKQCPGTSKEESHVPNEKLGQTDAGDHSPDGAGDKEVKGTNNDAGGVEPSTSTKDAQSASTSSCGCNTASGAPFGLFLFLIMLLIVFLPRPGEKRLS